MAETSTPIDSFRRDDSPDGTVKCSLVHVDKVPEPRPAFYTITAAATPAQGLASPAGRSHRSAITRGCMRPCRRQGAFSLPCPACARPWHNLSGRDLPAPDHEFLCKKINGTDFMPSLLIKTCTFSRAEAGNVLDHHRKPSVRNAIRRSIGRQFFSNLPVLRIGDASR